MGGYAAADREFGVAPSTEVQSMDLLKAIVQESSTLIAAPFSSITLMAVAGTAGFCFAKFHYARLADYADQRRQLWQDRAAMLATDIEKLKATASSSNLADLQRRIDGLPRFHRGPSEPSDAREGDIWLRTE